MAKSTIDGDMLVRGSLLCDGIVLPAASITNTNIAAFAAIAATKLQHQHQPCGAQPNTAAADETRVLHVVHGTSGSVVDFEAGSIGVAVGDAITTIDLKKNGTTILSAPITLDSGNVARTVEAAVISGGTLVAGDVLEVVIDATIGTGTLPTGVFWMAKIREDAD